MDALIEGVLDLFFGRGEDNSEDAVEEIRNSTKVAPDSEIQNNVESEEKIDIM